MKKRIIITAILLVFTILLIGLISAPCEGNVDCDSLGNEGDCYYCNCDWELGTCFGGPSCTSFDESDCNFCDGCTWVPPGPENFYINIGDSWQLAEAVYVNVGDVWQDVKAVYVNVGDVWQQIFSI